MVGERLRDPGGVPDGGCGWARVAGSSSGGLIGQVGAPVQYTEVWQSLRAPCLINGDLPSCMWRLFGYTVCLQASSRSSSSGSSSSDSSNNISTSGSSSMLKTLFLLQLY